MPTLRLFFDYSTMLKDGEIVMSAPRASTAVMKRPAAKGPEKKEEVDDEPMAAKSEEDEAAMSEEGEEEQSWRIATRPGHSDRLHNETMTLMFWGAEVKGRSCQFPSGSVRAHRTHLMRSAKKSVQRCPARMTTERCCSRRTWTTSARRR